MEELKEMQRRILKMLNLSITSQTLHPDDMCDTCCKFIVQIFSPDVSGVQLTHYGE